MNAVFDKTKKLYVIKNKDKLEEEVKTFIENKGLINLEITNDSDYKLIKKAKALLNNKVDEIKKSRISINTLLVGEIDSTCKALEKKLTEASEIQKAKIEAYEINVLHKEQKPKSLTLTIKSIDPEKLNKVLDYAKKLELEGEIK